MVNRDAVNCEQVWKEISNYLEGEVDAGARRAMDEHFGTCSRCRSVLEGTRNVIRLYGDERMIEVPAGFGRRLERRLAGSGRVRSGRATWSSWLIPVAALLLTAGGLRVASSRTVPHPLLSEHAQPAHGIPPDMVVVVSADAKEFHVPGCDFIHNKDKERRLTAAEAQREGYVPCVRCMRKYLQTASLGQTTLESEADAAADGEEEQIHAGR
jgi:putative zinc finger protein